VIEILGHIQIMRY